MRRSLNYTKNRIADANGKNLYISNEGYKMLISLVSSKLKRPLTHTDRTNLTQYIRNLNVIQFRGFDQVSIIKKIAYDYLHNPKIDEPWINATGVDKNNVVRDYQLREINQMAESEHQFGTAVHARREPDSILNDSARQNDILNYAEKLIKSGGKCEKAKVDIFMLKTAARTFELINKFFGAKTLDEVFARQTNKLTTFGNIALPHQRVLLDSRNRNIAHRYFRWDLIKSGSGGDQNGIRLIDDVQRIIKIDVHPFWLPIPARTVNAQFYKKIRMNIIELQDQGTAITERGTYERFNPYYQWEFDIKDTDTDRFYLVPTKQSWIPNKVVNEINSFTLQFFGPTDPVILDKDQFNVVITNTNPAIIQFNEPHLISSGSVIYITKFNSADMNINLAANRRDGWVANIISPTTLEISLDLSSLAGNTTAEVFLGIKRVQISIDITTLER